MFAFAFVLMSVFVSVFVLVLMSVSVFVLVLVFVSASVLVLVMVSVLVVVLMSVLVFVFGFAAVCDRVRHATSECKMAVVTWSCSCSRALPHLRIQGQWRSARVSGCSPRWTGAGPCAAAPRKAGCRRRQAPQSLARRVK